MDFGISKDQIGMTENGFRWKINYFRYLLHEIIEKGEIRLLRSTRTVPFSKSPEEPRIAMENNRRHLNRNAFSGRHFQIKHTPLLSPSLPLLPIQSDPPQVVLLGKFGVQNLHSPSWSHIKTFKMQIRINVELYFVAIECPLPPPPPLLVYLVPSPRPRARPLVNM